MIPTIIFLAGFVAMTIIVARRGREHNPPNNVDWSEPGKDRHNTPAGFYNNFKKR